MIRFVLPVLLVCLGLADLAKAQTGRTAIPVLEITNGGSAGGASSLKLSKLSVDVVVIGNIATTTFDMTFYNPLNKVLEGEF